MRRLILGWLLNVAYMAAIIVALPWVAWSMLFRGKYREGYAQKLLGCVPRRDGSGPCIWLHAVSVGEVNLLRTLIARIEDRWPDAQLCISSTTKTGFDLARQRFAQHPVFYCPLDFTWAVRRAMRRIRPDLLVLAELELWPNLIAAAKRQRAAVAIVNARLSDASFRGYRRIRPLIAGVLSQIDSIAAQDEATSERFRILGAAAERVSVTGSMKYDGAETNRNNAATKQLRALASIAEDDVVFLAGSTQAPEEQLAIETYRALADEFPQLRLIIVPRHPQRFDEVAGILSASGLPFIRRSQVIALASPPDPVHPLSQTFIETGQTAELLSDSGQAGTPDLLDATGSRFFFRGTESSGNTKASPAAKKEFRPLILIDTIGELSAWWGTATIAFVGGSLYSSRGGQNMIEPAAYGAAVCFGPNTKNFRDIVHALHKADAARVVADGNELTDFVRRCLTDRDWAAGLGERAQSLVRSQLGATERSLSLLAPQLDRRCARGDADRWIGRESFPRPAA